MAAEKMGLSKVFIQMSHVCRATDEERVITGDGNHLLQDVREKHLASPQCNTIHPTYLRDQTQASPLNLHVI